MQSIPAPVGLHPCGLATAAATAAVIGTTTAIVVIENQKDDDDEQDPCAAVSAAKYVPQTHSLPPPFNGYIPYYAASGEWLQHGAVKMRSLWIRHKPAKTAGRRRPPPPVAADGE